MLAMVFAELVLVTVQGGTVVAWCPQRKGTTAFHCRQPEAEADRQGKHSAGMQLPHTLLAAQARGAAAELVCVLPRPVAACIPLHQMHECVQVETCHSIATVPQYWNVNTGIFLRRYVYERVGKGTAGLATTQVVSGLWHGLREGHMLFFLMSIPMFAGSKGTRCCTFLVLLCLRGNGHCPNNATTYQHNRRT